LAIYISPFKNFPVSKNEEKDENASRKREGKERGEMVHQEIVKIS